MSHATGDLGCQAGPPVSEDNLGHEFEAKRDLPRQEAEAHTRHKLISFDMREEVCLCLCVCVCVFVCVCVCVCVRVCVCV